MLFNQIENEFEKLYTENLHCKLKVLHCGLLHLIAFQDGLPCSPEYGYISLQLAPLSEIKSQVVL